MKRAAALAICLCLMMGLGGGLFSAGQEGYALPTPEKVSARSALLVSLGETAAGDVVIFAREADVRRGPGAALRVLAGVYALREIRAQGLDLDADSGTYTRAEQALITGTGLAVANMKVGDTWTLRDLLTVSMMDSAADACVTLAVRVSGSVEQFVAGMNALAAEWGCADTRAANVTGLDDPAQYTTARDLYTVARHAMSYPELTHMMQLATYDVRPVKGAAQTRSSTCPMLRRNTEVYYEAALFGRTGYTDLAGRCMVSAARANGYEYLAVVLGSGMEGGDLPTAHVRDSRVLYDWAFSTFAYQVLVRKDQPVSQVGVELAWSTDTLPLVAKDSFSSVVHKQLDISTLRIVPVLDTQRVEAPVEKGAVLGRAEIYINIDQRLGEVELVAGHSAPRSELLAFWRWARGVLGSKWLYIGLGSAILLVGGYILLSVALNRKKRRRVVNKRKGLGSDLRRRR